jgi:hypothetical protein
MQVDLQIDHHPSGNRTLKQRDVGQTMWSDLRDDLLANSNEATFYHAVVRHIGHLLEAGHQVKSITDTSS